MKAANESQTALAMSQNRGRARAESSEWFQFHRGHSQIAIRDATPNIGGWASNQDEDAIIAAAFPDAD